ncbi:hypothetical protein ID866_5773 [Astraeus odoratus]|nr:hypothetical protein ID866_5773 [Astraeus odoratus]
MGKNKTRDQVPDPRNVANKDIIQRLNFLYQASILLNTMSPAVPQPPLVEKPTLPKSQDNQKKRRRRRQKRVVTMSELSRSYIDTMKTVGQKTNVKLDPSVKRRLCKACSLVLLPGVSATVRVKSSTSHGHLVSYTCHSCQTERRIPAPPVASSPPADDQPNGVPDGDHSMGEVASVPATAQSRGCRRKKRGPIPRLPPHFARDDLGHVVFCGDEIIPSANPPVMRGDINDRQSSDC